MNVLTCEPISVADVHSQQVRVQLFALRQKMAHVDSACGAAEYTDGVKESRKGKDPLRFGQSPREDRLQHDAADKSDESKRLPDAGEQLGAVEVLGRPRAAVLRIQPGSKGSTGKADGEKETRIKFAQQQKCSREREGNKWDSAPDDRRSNLFGFEPEQIGPAIIWSAVPLIPLAFTAALLLLRKFDPRLLLAIGLACTAFAAWLNSQYSSTWSAENFYRTELLTGVGQAFAFIGLVGCIVLQAIFAGALARPEWVLTFSAFFHTIRIFGGTAGAIYMGHFLAQREKLHSNLLGLHVSNGDWLTDQNIHAMTAGLYAKSSGLVTAGARAVDLIAARMRLQAFSLSIIDGFLLIAWSCVCALILVALLRKSPLNYGDLSTVQQTPAIEKESKQ